MNTILQFFNVPIYQCADWLMLGSAEVEPQPGIFLQVQPVFIKSAELKPKSNEEKVIHFSHIDSSKYNV
jgi:hypothetical protein